MSKSYHEANFRIKKNRKITADIKKKYITIYSTAISIDLNLTN